MIALLVGMGAVAYTVPFVGFGVSLLLPFVAHWCRHVLWPRASTALSFIWASLVLVGLWWAVVAVIMLPVFLPPMAADTFQHSAFWLVFPLCGPSHAAAWVIPGLMATIAYTVGLLGTAWLRRPWPWLVGAWLAPLAYQAAMTWLVDNTFIC